jgi:hypothetical protein
VSTPSPIKERRFGRFIVSDELIEHEGDALPDLFADMVVVRAERRFDLAAIEYVAAGPMFDPLPRGTMAPLYSPWVRVVTMRDPVNDADVKMPAALAGWTRLDP